MIKTIVKDTFFLSAPSTTATAADLPVAQDLLDTLRANLARCVGMAANMIGVKKRIIVFSVGPMMVVMINPKITEKRGAYSTEEGCLSLTGSRPATRYRDITVEYQDMSMKKHVGKYTGAVAQVIQHEVDHCDGIII